MPRNPDLLTTSQVCEALGGLHASTVNRWVQLGKIKPTMKLPGATGGYLFRRSEIEALAAKRAADDEPAA